MPIFPRDTKADSRANAGMFLFAKLVMGNMLDQTTRSGLRNEMRPELFPSGLEQAFVLFVYSPNCRGPNAKAFNRYKRIFDRILAPAASRFDALRLLAWVTCATRSLQRREAQAANIIACKIDENDDFDEDADQSIQIDDMRWRVDHTGLCGPLVEQRPNGNLEIVHYTATQ